MDGTVDRAYNEFMTRLFGYVPENPRTLTVDRETYTKVMQEIQEKYGLEQGHPDFLEWTLTLVGRSPRLTKEKGAGTNDSTSTEDIKTVGEASLGEADRE